MTKATIARLWLGPIVVAALLGGGAATTSAHVQVTPTLAAPDDAVRFTVLVPGERSDTFTDRVAVKVPRGVLPYSFGDTPGWERRLILAEDQSVDQIVWTGTTEPDGFVEFSFLAATPPQPTVLVWKALQRYANGEVVRWIGSADADEPAARTEVRADAPLQNAGGEGASRSGREAGLEAEPAQASAVPDSSSDDGVARALGIVAVVLAGAALAVAWRRGRST